MNRVLNVRSCTIAKIPGPVNNIAGGEIGKHIGVWVRRSRRRLECSLTAPWIAHHQYRREGIEATVGCCNTQRYNIHTGILENVMRVLL